MIEQEIRTPAPDTGDRERRRTRILVVGGGIFVALILLRLITGESDITSSGTMGATLALAVPIGMAALGGMWSERSGVINIGLEGMMTFGTWGAAFASYFSGNPWLGLLGGIVAGAVGGLLHAVATVTFGVDHIVSGVAINILAPGVTRYLSDLLFTDEKGGGATQSPPLPSFPTWSVPGVGKPLGSLEKHHWILVSDLAGLVRGVLTNLSPITLVGILLVPVSYYLLWRTAFGLRLRSCGENPVAAESLGVKVYRMKYSAVVISGALAGIGGVFLAMVASSNYQEGQVNGRGYIGLAAMIFGNWRPGMVAGGAGLFGYTDALQLRGGGRRGARHAVADRHRAAGAGGLAWVPATGPRGGDLDRGRRRRARVVLPDRRAAAGDRHVQPAHHDAARPRVRRATAADARRRRHALSTRRRTLMADIDWPALREAARAAMARAYAPYSGYPVGAAGLTDDGRIVTGCNVENASYGVGLCAECGLVSALHGTGGGRLVAVSVVEGHGDPVMPCGRCRQLLWEHGGPSMLLETTRGVRPMSEVLPDAFGPDDLEK